MRLRKFVIRSFCRSARVKTEKGVTIHIPSLLPPSHWMVNGCGGGTYQGARSGSELIAVTLAPDRGADTNDYPAGVQRTGRPDRIRR